MTALLDVNSLYPVIHDIDEEYENQPYFCCSDGPFLIGGIFSLKDLVQPLTAPVPASSLRSVQSERPSPQRQRQRSWGSAQRDVPEDISSTTISVPRSNHFHDVYVLTRQIHRGKYSTVWEIVHRISGERYAAKIFDRRLLSPREDAAAMREITILEQLGDNPVGTARLIDSYQESTHYYIVMEYVEGGNLLSRVIQRQALGESEARKFAMSLLEGVRYLHHQDICHRNLKPDNILFVFGGGDVKVTDFGLAAHLPYNHGKKGYLKGRCGSATFGAPELQKGERYDTQADMWSVGVIMYFCLAGVPPFVDKSSQGLLRKVTKAEYSFNSKQWSGISRNAKRFISALLHVDPQVRMTADEALEHPWLIPDRKPLPSIKEVADEAEGKPKKGKKKKKSLGRMWKALVGNSEEGKTVSESEGEGSYSSFTMSLASGDQSDASTVKHPNLNPNRL